MGKYKKIIRIQTSQNIALRKLINAPPYVLNHTIHNDLKIKYVQDEAKTFYKRFHSSLVFHPNPLVNNLACPAIPGNPPKRLKHNWYHDLLAN